MRTLCLLTLLCSAASAAPIPKELKKRDGIVGVWKLESIKIFGKASSVDANETEWTIEENFALTRSGSQKGPQHQIRLTQLKIDTATKAVDWPKSEFLGRYEVSGDQLTICLSMPDNPRPTTLEPNANNYVWVLRRVDK